MGDKDEEVVEVVHTCARSLGEMDSEINTTNSLLSILIDKYALGVMKIRNRSFWNKCVNASRSTVVMRNVTPNTMFMYINILQ